MHSASAAANTRVNTLRPSNTSSRAAENQLSIPTSHITEIAILMLPVRHTGNYKYFPRCHPHTAPDDPEQPDAQPSACGTCTATTNLQTDKFSMLYQTVIISNQKADSLFSSVRR